MTDHFTRIGTVLAAAWLIAGCADLRARELSVSVGLVRALGGGFEADGVPVAQVNSH